MNVLYKAYCRTYQTILRMALPALPYRTPEILRSAGEILRSAGEIPGLLGKNAPGRALIVTDRGCVQAGLLKILTDALKEGDQQYTVFDGVVSNPTTDTVDQALGKFTREKCVSLIGLGGGSSMDCAKAVGARIASRYPSR
ncbi:iron-containing alcohol dehydrogenase [Mobilibacterium timonense]|uniref:iron-containing alcohol dehydrogenase n=1 Tax=Mobilibacterium timonense TaxID=1871012 RepID=UPI0009876F1E|nr:iron-containing alcohol dehydrogenase [Mobilibacterium timonense]